jgi:superfamily I DNA/RNA helicase
MEIGATEDVLRFAREKPEAVRSRVRELIYSGAEEGVRCADRLEDDRYLGWIRNKDELDLLYLVKPEPEKESSDRPLLAGMSMGELRAIGVPDDLVPSVQRFASLEDLESMDLDQSVKKKLRFLLLQQLRGLAASSTDLTRVAMNLEHFDEYLHGDISQLLLNLDASQRHIVEMEAKGTVVVRGVAGSGKTAVALHRIYRLLRQRSLLLAPRILFLTFNRSLSVVSQELLNELGVRTGDLEVQTLHQWCWNFLKPGFKILESREQWGLIHRAIKAAIGQTRPSALWQYPRAFWEGEIHLIQSRVTGDREEYLHLHRYKTGRALDQNLRFLVWVVYAEYVKRKSGRNKLDWDDVVRMAYQRLQNMGEQAPRYDYVIVDEAQDFTVLAMRIVALLSREPGSLFISYDPAQSLYERGLRWKDCGITVHGGRSFDLKRNYRNTCEILEAAVPLLKDIGGEIEAGEENLVLSPEKPTRSGECPRFLVTRSGEELSAVSRDIGRLIEDIGIPPQNIAVLCYPNGTRDRMARELERANIFHQCHNEGSSIQLSDRSVKVLPLKSAKGLEFPVVYLIASRDFFRVPKAASGAEEANSWQAEMRRALYMGMTRAMNWLTIVHAEGRLTDLLGCLHQHGTSDDRRGALK